MTRVRAAFRCFLVGHRWGIENSAATVRYAPCLCCTRCGLPRWAADLRPTTSELVLGLIPVACVIAGTAAALLIAGGAR